MFSRYSLLPFDKFGRSTVAVAHASGIYISGKLHPAKPASGLVARQELFDIISHRTLAAVHRRGRSRSKRQYQFLALQLVARTAVREPVPEGFFHPTLQYRRCGIPEHRK